MLQQRVTKDITNIEDKYIELPITLNKKSKINSRSHIMVEYLNLIAFLKKKITWGIGQKKASVFTKDKFVKFLLEAPDEKFLNVK